MRQSQFAISILASILLTLAGCGDDEGDGTRGTDAGEQIADAGEGPAEDAGAADAGQQTEDAGQLVGDAGHPHALRGEGFGDGQADASAGPGDECGLAVQSEIHDPYLS